MTNSRPTFVCPDCGFVSYNPNDIREQYCGLCHTFPEDRAMSEPKYDHEVHRDWVQKIQSEGRDLTEWEENFVQDLAERFTFGRKLVSKKQEDILERIYVEKTPTN